MYLKSLEIHGFKSFGDRTRVEFHKGVTAIVGPNGCGKSNVLDAMRWVLGEQSAKALRGGQMQDVIFNGSDTRKPLGMAEVSLTFGDCEQTLGTDFNEMTITRRIFRDGSSEYEMNKVGCRLRDIQQTFMDTGIGRSSYSIMEQGKIDLILSARPEDRRMIFEEAAGVTKFKSQKKEALRKLEQTEANLLRLVDIVTEVKRQIGSLQRQAGKARRYKELSEELRGLETRLSRYQFDKMSREIREIQSALDGLTETHEGLTRSVELQENELQSRREELSIIDARINQHRGQQNEVRLTEERAIQRIQNNEARIEEYAHLVEQARIEVSGIDEKIRIQNEQLTSIDIQLADATEQVNQSRYACDSREEEMRGLAGRLEQLLKTKAAKAEEMASVEKTLNELRHQLAALELQQHNFRFRIDNMKSEQSGLEARHAEAETLRTQEAESLMSAEESVKSVKGRREELQQQLTAMKEEIRLAEKIAREAQQKHQSCLAQREALQQLERNHAGTPKAAREVFTAAQSGTLGTGILGTLSDYLNVQPGFEKAMALLLGETLGALVVENRDAADAIVRFMNDRESGQLEAVVLSLKREIPVTLLNEPDHALRYLQMNDLVRDVVSNLLSDCYIVQDLESAYSIKNRLPQATVATLSGEMISSSGVLILGQAAGASLDVLVRQNEIKCLDEDAALLGVESSERHLEFERLQFRQQEIGQQMQDLQAEVQASEIEAARLRHTHETLLNNVRQIERQRDTLIQEMDRLIAQDQADRERQSQVVARAQEEETRLRQINEETVGLGREVELVGQEEFQLRQQLTEFKIKLATLTQQRDNLDQQRSQNQSRLQELTDLQAQRTRAISDYESRIIQAREEISRSENEQREARSLWETIETELTRSAAEREEHLVHINEREQLLRGQRKELSEIQNRRSAFEVQVAERNMRLGNLRERIERTYQMTLEDLPLPVEGDPEPNWDEVELAVSEKRSRIDAMGPVNLDAITEYEELEQRHTLLESQHQDLTNSRQDLLQAIAKINETTQTLFAETFVKIRDNFKLTFTELFGGGEADLRLMDEGDPLECGIDIIAKPPGKQLRSITLLSGGEKTMTAVALLFAIYQVKPSPFCVLDEMDAPLDESNINRFIKMVQRFVLQSQFVVITHNKRTIGMADALYGVTMEERGVSKLLSYRLNKDNSNGATNGHANGYSNGNGNGHSNGNTPSLVNGPRETIPVESSSLEANTSTSEVDSSLRRSEGIEVAVSLTDENPSVMNN